MDGMETTGAPQGAMSWEERVETLADEANSFYYEVGSFGGDRT